jgi:dTDP-4-dehydrorhamnose reductase
MTAGGQTTWFEFARTILADEPRVTVRPITTADYPRPAKRPAYSVLDNSKLERVFGVTLPSWQAQWQAFNATPV